MSGMIAKRPTADGHVGAVVTQNLDENTAARESPSASFLEIRWADLPEEDWSWMDQDSNGPA
eukprot:9981723-Karenia_brevis.AAC.1